MVKFEKFSKLLRICELPCCYDCSGENNECKNCTK